ncbi:cyclase family protein [Actinophytocola sp.]|uniref:cyclase family protein n=1 Tax=Actinophytocola sp. TaxID=1872138 RepID=UPI003D6B1A32
MVRDCSHVVTTSMMQIPHFPPTKVHQFATISDGHPLNVTSVALTTHSGTHMDAPSHAIEGGRTIQDIDLDECHGSALVIPVRAKPSTMIHLTDLRLGAHTVREGDILLLATGWSRHYGQPAYYDNPHLSAEVADWVLARGAKLLGVDFLTVDRPMALRGDDFDFPIHHTLLGADLPLIENLTNLPRERPVRMNCTAFPLTIEAADGAPVRVVLHGG